MGGGAGVAELLLLLSVVVVVERFWWGGGTEGVGSRGGWGELMPKVLVAQGCDSLLVLEVACQVLFVLLCLDSK